MAIQRISTMSNQQHTEDEIDLGILLLRITKSLFRNIWLIVTCIILGLGVGIGVFYTKKPVYKSEMIVQSSILTNAYIQTLSENLNQLVKENNKALLSTKLSLDQEGAALISTIEIITVAEEIIKKEDGSEIFDNLFKVYVEVSDNQVLPSLQSGILMYLEKSPYVSKQVNAKKKGLVSLLEKVENELLSMDTLKSDLNNSIRSNNVNESNVVIFDPATIYSNSLEFFESKIKYEQELAIVNGVQLIDGFVPFNNPVSPKKLISVFIGICVGLFLAFMIIFLKEIRIYLKKLDQEINPKD